jgi:hypothetical protein
VALTSEPSGIGPVSRAADALARAAAPRRRDPAAPPSQISADLGRVSQALLLAGGARRGQDAALVLAVVVSSARLVTQIAELLRAQDEVRAAGAARAAAARLLPVVHRAAGQGVVAPTATLEAAPPGPVAHRTAARVDTVPRQQPDRREERDGGR